MTTGVEMRAEEHLADAISAVLSRTPLFEGLPAPTYPELASSYAVAIVRTISSGIQQVATGQPTGVHALGRLRTT